MQSKTFRLMDQQVCAGWKLLKPGKGSIMIFEAHMKVASRNSRIKPFKNWLQPVATPRFHYFENLDHLRVRVSKIIIS